MRSGPFWNCLLKSLEMGSCKGRSSEHSSVPGARHPVGIRRSKTDEEARGPVHLLLCCVYPEQHQESLEGKGRIQEWGEGAVGCV